MVPERVISLREISTMVFIKSEEFFMMASKTIHFSTNSTYRLHPSQSIIIQKDDKLESKLYEINCTLGI